MEGDTSRPYHAPARVGYPVAVTIPDAVLAKWQDELADEIAAPGPLGFSRTLALIVARESPRFDVRSGWGRREREAWAARICAGIDAARRATPITAAEIRARNGWRTSWEVVVPVGYVLPTVRPRRARRSSG